MKRFRPNKLTTAIIICLIFSIFMACGSSGDATAPAPVINTPAPTPTPVPDPEPEPIPDPASITYSLILYDSGGVGISNGTVYQHLYNGTVTHISPGTFTVNDLIYQIDQTGAVISTTQLPAIPSAVTIAPNGDIWTFEDIPPVYAAANGGMYDYYTCIWQNYSEYIPWVNNNWTIGRALSTASGDVIAYDTPLNRAVTVTDAVVTHYASEGGILIHSVDPVNRIGKVRTADGNYNISWSTNYFNSADEWLEIDGTWYSWNGYRWNVTDGLTEQDAALADFINWTMPVIIAAGTRMSASLERGYWIEANTGWLWMYTPDMDRLEQVVRLYTADGERMTGVNHAADMEPQIIAGVLYYTFEGVIWRYDFASGINGPFMTGKSVRAL